MLGQLGCGFAETAQCLYLSVLLIKTEREETENGEIGREVSWFQKPMTKSFLVVSEKKWEYAWLQSASFFSAT